jgi:uncharacterized protein
MKTTSLGLVSAAIANAVVLGCGAGGAGSAVRPKETTAAEALGEGKCHEVAGMQGEPLIVDWKPEQRDDLEIAMKEGVAVVSFSCKAIKILSDCKIEGSYGFLGTTRKEQVVQLKDADELSVNLPLSGANLGSELSRGSTIDIALVTIGKKRTTWGDVTTGDLSGKCDGATHFVRGATIGAFVMDTGTEGKVRVAAEMFGAGASGKSESSQKIGSKQGDLSDCAKATPDSEKPPSQCGSPIRLVLYPIAASKGDAPPPAAEKQPERPPSAEEARACPEGLVFAEGKCTKPSASVAYVCKPGDVEDCKTQCGKGNAESCGELGLSLMRTGSGGSIPDVPQNREAFEPLKKGCDGDSARACGALGSFHLAGVGTKRDLAAAAKSYEKACAGGDAIGCRELGRFYSDGDAAGVTKDDAKAAALYRQACEGGDRVGCSFHGHMLVQGTGVEKDPRRGLDYLQRACQGGFAPACNFVGQQLESGKLVGKNPILAEITFRRGCWQGADFAASCTGLGRLLFAKNDENGAKMALQRGCAFGDSLACAVQKVAFGTNRPAIPNATAVNEAMKACGQGDARACTNWGLYQTLQSAQIGKPNVQRGCTMGDAFGCAIVKKLP